MWTAIHDTKSSITIDLIQGSTRELMSNQNSTSEHGVLINNNKEVKRIRDAFLRMADVGIRIAPFT